jgi:hypothetical protein
MEPKANHDRDLRFEALQAKLVPLWHSIQTLTHDAQTIVVVPSIDVDLPLLSAEMQAYEERYLFLLLLLRQPRARMIYVTGQAIHPDIVDYYLDLLPGVIASHARKRLDLVSPLDASDRALARKLLDRPRLVERIRSLIPDADRAHLVPFAATEEDKQLALELGIPMYGADPKHHDLGTKSRCRQLFREEGVALPLGAEDLHGEDDLCRALLAMRRERPGLRKVVVKLDEGVSGMGNANLALAGLPAVGDPEEAEAVRTRLRGMSFELGELTYEDFLEKLAEQGGIVEERIEAEQIESPSVQLRVTPLGDVELLSTHDQLLGGTGGTSFLGCRFPADTAYAPHISREALKVGRRLASEGVLGRFALDFVVAGTGEGDWAPYAIEINLRKGGTTHPFLTLQFLTDGTYDPETGHYTASSGQRKFFVASDHVESEAYRAFTHEDLFDIVAIHGLHFDQTRETGVVFHMLSALPQCGRVGLTAVADSPEEAQALHDRTVAALDDAARAHGQTAQRKG